MKKKFIYIFIALALIIGSFNYSPYILDTLTTSKNYAKLKLEVKRINYGNNFFEYFEGGSGETIVMVHGFHGTKQTWLKYCEDLVKNYHVIAMDLPAHGNSSMPTNQHFDIYSLEKSLALFIELKNLKNFHIFGSSMGGGIATIYCYNHPENVKSLVLINPLGIATNEKSDLEKQLLQGKNILLPSSLAEVNEYFIYIIGKVPNINTYYKWCFLKKVSKDKVFWEHAFNELIKSKPLDDILPKVTTKSLILIGENDRVINPISYEVFVEEMPHIEATRLEGAPHAFVGSYLTEALLSINNFLKENP